MQLKIKFLFVKKRKKPNEKKYDGSNIKDPETDKTSLHSLN